MASKPHTEPIQNVEHSFSMINLRQVCVHDTFIVSLSLINMFNRYKFHNVHRIL